MLVRERVKKVELGRTSNLWGASIGGASCGHFHVRELCSHPTSLSRDVLKLKRNLTRAIAIEWVVVVIRAGGAGGTTTPRRTPPPFGSRGDASRASESRVGIGRMSRKL